MIAALYAVDEETDAPAYAAYLREQSNDDILDILRNLDPERYPARLDAALREARRRLVVQTPLYSTAENAVRHVAVAAFLLAAALLTLTFLLTTSDAAGLSVSAESMITEGTPVSEIIRVAVVALLRAVVLCGARCGVYTVVLVWLSYWLATRGWRLRAHRARLDVWRLCGVAWLALVGALISASVPQSAVPALANRPAGAMRTLWPLDPFLNTGAQ
jgi:hypothetical protein